MKISFNRVSVCKIRSVFAAFVGTVFEWDIDAAFNSDVQNEAYIFKGPYYARVNMSNSRYKSYNLRKENQMVFRSIFYAA